MVKALDKIWNSLPDADDLFAYDTVKEVRVLDRRLGLVYYTVLGLVVFYVTATWIWENLATSRAPVKVVIRVTRVFNDVGYRVSDQQEVPGLREVLD